MWVSLPTNLQYRFSETIPLEAFFRELRHLLTPTDTLVLGCYEARLDIEHYLATRSVPPAWARFQPTECWDLNREEHPRGAAFHLRTESSTLARLARFATEVERSCDLCDHVAGYSSSEPVFIYHDAFIEPLFVSTNVPPASVDAFARAVGKPFDIIDFEQTYQRP